MCVCSWYTYQGIEDYKVEQKQKMYGTRGRILDLEKALASSQTTTHNKQIDANDKSEYNMVKDLQEHTNQKEVDAQCFLTDMIRSFGNMNETSHTTTDVWFTRFQNSWHPYPTTNVLLVHCEGQLE